MLTNYIIVWFIIMIVEMFLSIVVGLMFGEGYLSGLVMLFGITVLVGVIIWGVMQYLADNGKISW